MQSLRNRKTKMTKPKILFEEGCFDSMDDLTQQEMDDLIAEIELMAETGELFDYSVPVDELPQEEQEEIYNMINKRKNTRQ